MSTARFVLLVAGVTCLVLAAFEVKAPPKMRIDLLPAGLALCGISMLIQ